MINHASLFVSDLAQVRRCQEAPSVGLGLWQVKTGDRNLFAYLSAADARTISTAFATLADDIDAREAATAVTVDTDPTPAHGTSRDLGADGRQDGAA